MTDRQGTALLSRSPRGVARAAGVRALVLAFARVPCAAFVSLAVVTACNTVGGIDNNQISTVSNDDTYATLSGMWAGAQAAINAKREPLTGTFTLPLTYTLACPAGGARSYQGTLTGTNTAGTGSATLAMTATLTNCAFDDKVRITTVTAMSVALTGTIQIRSDAYSTIALRMVASGVTVNTLTCTGGIDVTLSAPTPSSQPVATGTSCGRTGAVPLP